MAARHLRKTIELSKKGPPQDGRHKIQKRHFQHRFQKTAPTRFEITSVCNKLGTMKSRARIQFSGVGVSKHRFRPRQSIVGPGIFEKEYKDQPFEFCFFARLVCAQWTSHPLGTDQPGEETKFKRLAFVFLFKCSRAHDWKKQASRAKKQNSPTSSRAKRNKIGKPVIFCCYIFLVFAAARPQSILCTQNRFWVPKIDTQILFWVHKIDFGYPKSISGYPKSILGSQKSILGTQKSIFGTQNQFWVPKIDFWYPKYILVTQNSILGTKN